jgi:hypothetical protein
MQLHNREGRLQQAVRARLAFAALCCLGSPAAAAPPVAPQMELLRQKAGFDCIRVHTLLRLQACCWEGFLDLIREGVRVVRGVIILKNWKL